MNHQIIEVKGIGEPGSFNTITFKVNSTDPATEASKTSSGTVYLSEPTIATSDEDLIAVVLETNDYERITQQIEAGFMQGRTQLAAPSSAATPAFVPLTPEQQRAQWVKSIDSTVEMISHQFTRFQMEYVEREAAAKAYIESNYTIDPTTWITRFADNKRLGYPEVAALILQQAVACREALKALGELRMDKYLVEDAPDMQTAQAEYDKVIAACFVINGNLP
jgi:hypothetical protein